MWIGKKNTTFFFYVCISASCKAKDNDNVEVDVSSTVQEKVNLKKKTHFFSFIQSKDFY